MLKKISIFVVFVALFSSKSLFAGEGMWLPYLLEKLNASEMQRMGMKISAEEIYSVNKSSLKDAIVMFGRGCTGEIVSEQGLVLTNHHCGYGEIQKHSSIEHDYLTNGFWAQNFEQELSNPGLSVRLLTNMEDVTSQILQNVTSSMTESERAIAIQNNVKELLKDLKSNKFNEFSVKSFYNGNQFIMMAYQVFYDVRLVGAPPSNIGKFGGDTDNWMWPRHTGDFSVFRIYANKNNEPADFSKENVPYKPKRALEISLKGVQKGDFTFVYGYPGTTQEYLPAAALELITKKVNPFAIEMRTQRLDIMAAAMKNDAKIRIQYSAKYAGVANGWKKWQGENKGIERLKAIEKKTKMEADFAIWAMDANTNYSNLLPTYNKLYKEYTDWKMGYTYFLETGNSIELVRLMRSFITLADESNSKTPDTAKIEKIRKGLLVGIVDFYKDYDKNVDKQLFIALLKAYKSSPYTSIPHPTIFNFIDKKYKGDVDKYADYVYAKSMFTNQESVKLFLEQYNAKSAKKLISDPIFVLASSIFDNFFDSIQGKHDSFQVSIDSLQRIYMKAQMEKNSDSRWYPDANSTLRIAYGKVDSYFPKDAVEYNYFTTLDGIMQKENPDIYDYVVEPKLKELYNNKDYGRYGDKDGKMHTCFIASNHTTGGNSGSPVLNAEGQLIGLNFDRDWEGTMSDLMYDPDQCRNITLDIRYCLFIIDKFAGASRLVQEMKIIQ